MALFVAATPVTVSSPGVAYSAAHITATVDLQSTSVSLGPGPGEVTATPRSQRVIFTTQRRVPRTGVMVVGLGGNNGSTLAAGLLANRLGLSWRTRSGEQKASWLGSLTQSATVRLGSSDSGGGDVFVPFSSLLPMVAPSDLYVGGWDISSLKMVKAVERAQVLDVDLQRTLAPHLAALYPESPLPSIYYPSFIAANQAARADNLLLDGGGTKQQHLDLIRQQIRAFGAQHGLETTVVLWSANTERFCEERAGLNDSAASLLAAIARDEPEISASTIFAVAALLERCSFINGSPQNTFARGVVDLAEQLAAAGGPPRAFLVGDDLKSGQTKVKSVLAEFLVASGFKPLSIASYNHLGNNDGLNLIEEAQFKAKEKSKSTVIDDIVASNGLVYAAGERPEHLVVIRYVAAVGDSKRALDEITSEIFLGGRNTIVLHNTCEDSLLAAPLMLDLVLLVELFQRIDVRRLGSGGEEEGGLDPVLSLLSFFVKAPQVKRGAPVVNGLSRQREALVNFLRACIGLPPDSSVDLEHRLRRTHEPAPHLMAAAAAHEPEKERRRSVASDSAASGDIGGFFRDQGAVKHPAVASPAHRSLVVSPR